MENNLISIINQDGELLVTSREVAENFGKRHDSVLRDIDNLVSSLEPTQNCGSLFKESEYKHEQNKQTYRKYLITRDGFSLLVMGFTGQKALDWKLKYIEAFNKMEESLRQAVEMLSDEQKLQLAIFNAKSKDEAVMASAELDRYRKEHIQLLEPKAEYYDKTLIPDKLITTTDIAKDLSMSARKLNKILHELRVIYPKKVNGKVKGWYLYSEYEHLVPRYADYHIGEYSQSLKWTELGRKFIIEKLEENEII